MNTIAITGASGYIGSHLVSELVRRGGRRVKVLCRSDQRVLHADRLACGVDMVEGDMRDAASLRRLLEPGCTVVNLAYLTGAGLAENLAATVKLLDACRATRAARLIHCSTASVVGRAPARLVTESTLCRPATEYGITKLEVERVVLDAAQRGLEATILRPTAVFGYDGENLKRLVVDLTTGNRLRNYLKSCLFGKRRMNLVYVCNVVAAILFLANYSDDLTGEVFNISDADNPSNNFLDVERLLMRQLDIPAYSLPRLPLPLGFLAVLLRSLGRDNPNPRCDYSSEKLIALGFERPVSFETGMTEYTTWYRSAHQDKVGAGVA